MIVAGIGATLQLFRLSVDFIATASRKDAAVTEKLEKATPAQLREQLRSSRRSSLFLSLQRVKKDTSTSINAPNEHIDSISNTQHSKGADVEQETPTIEEEEIGLSSTEKTIIGISTIVNFAFFAYFLTVCIINGTGQGLEDALYDAVPMGCSATAFFIATLLCMRDYWRSRFTLVSRALHTMSALILALGALFRITISDETPSNIDIVSLSLLIVFAIVALIECKVVPWPHAVMKDEKARLSLKSILVVLKPYFWPDATSTSATLNRIRALATWVFVIASKACTLLAPIYLGRASTELTRMNYDACIRNVIYFCLLTFAGFFFKEAQSLVYLRVAQAAFVQLAELAFRHLHSLSLDWHLKKKLGEVIRSMDRGILACDTLIKYLFLWLVPAIGECLLVTIIFATYFDYLPLAVTVFFFVFVYIVMTVLMTLWRKKFRKQVARSDNDWHDRATDSLINFETVKYFTAEDYEMKKFGEAVEAFQTGSVNVAASLSALNLAQRILLQACLATSLSLTTIAIRDRMNCCIDNGCIDGNSECCSNLSGSCPGMEIGDFVAVLTYTLNLFTPLNFLGSVYNAIVMAIVDLTNLSELLAENPDVTDAKDALQLPATNERDPDTVAEFDNVRFHYPSQPEVNGLKGVSFKMKKGTITAVVGSTGAGKTTISRLLFRFYDVTGGAVKVNGMDVRMLAQKSLREKIGVVPQATTMFNDTLGENIRYGRRDATEEELDEVARAAQLTEFIESLPEGWDTLVGDRGLKLSGGEKQRTAIARCLLKNPPIVILDEATSALDTITESSVQEALDRLGNDRTVLVIAHRLGTIKNADNIIVLRDGMVAEEGSHEVLLAKGGQYADMWNMQLSSTKTSTSSFGLDVES